MRETGLLRLGVVSIDGTKIDADASKYRSVRYDRIEALPEELARRETMKAKLNEACARLEADAREQVETARPAYKKKAAYDAKTGRRGRAGAETA